MKGKIIYGLNLMKSVVLSLFTSVVSGSYHGQRILFLDKLDSFRRRGDSIKIHVDVQKKEQHRQVRMLIIDFYLHGWDSDSLPVEFVDSEPYDVEIALNEDWGVTVSGTIRGDEISYNTELPLAPVRDGVAPEGYHGVDAFEFDTDPITVVGGELEQVDGVYVCEYYDAETNTVYVDIEESSGGDSRGEGGEE